MRRLTQVPAIPKQSLNEIEFSEESFPELFRPALSPMAPLVEDPGDQNWNPGRQLGNIAHYLSAQGGARIIIESHYVDRDFIEDFSAYYSRSFAAYPNFCSRLHFFRPTPAFPLPESLFDVLRKLRDLLYDRAVSDEPEDTKPEFDSLRLKLSSWYLGFMVVRPLPNTPIGRTVLISRASYRDEYSYRTFRSTRRYRVHLAGIRLSVRGIAYQQQDQGTSACATTSLWSALQKSSTDNLRTPSPAEITALATTYALPGGRALPSDGLVVAQMCEAVRGAGLAPYLYRHVDAQTTKDLLYLAIASGLPAVALVKNLSRQDQDPGHAVTLVGGRIEVLRAEPPKGERYCSRATSLTALYVHDDRLGPYITAEILDVAGTIRMQAPSDSVDSIGPDGSELPRTVGGDPGSEPNRAIEDSNSPVFLRLRIPGHTQDDHYAITYLLLPLHNKIRISQKTLLGIANSIGHRLGELLPQIGVADAFAMFEVRILRGTEYLEELLGVGLLSQTQAQVVAEELTLSNYVGVIRFGMRAGVGEDRVDLPLLDIVIDTTGTERHSPVLALIELISPPELKPYLRLLTEDYPAALAIFEE